MVRVNAGATVVVITIFSGHLQENGKITDMKVMYMVHNSNFSMYTTYNLRNVCGCETSI